MADADHPRLPFAPLLIDYELRLPTGPWRVFMANTVSLLPGTLSAKLQAGSLTVHALDGSQESVTEALQFWKCGSLTCLACRCRMTNLL